MIDTPNRNTETPRIYVACLAVCNNGKLHGTWLDATQEPDDIMGEVQAMLKASPEPDSKAWAIHDYEEFCDISLSEWAGFEQVRDYALFVQEYKQLGAAVYSYYGNLKEAREALTELYAGCYKSIGEFAEGLTLDVDIPDNVRDYIDYERMARDMEIDGDFFTIKTAHDEAHVFWVGWFR